MATFEPPAINTDTEALTADILDRLAARLPGWEPVEGSIETALAEEFAATTAVVAQAAVDSITVALSEIGTTVFGLAPIVATAAQISAVVTVSAPGDVIPSGLELVGTSPAGVEVVFRLPADVTATSVEQVVLVIATTPGSVANDVTGELVVATSTLTVVSARVATASDTGAASAVPGTDAEAVETYLSRLVEHLSALRVGGVTGEDLAAVARTVPGVWRAVGLDLVDPNHPNDETPRYVTMAAVDRTGAAVSAPVLAALQEAVTAVREVNFTVSHIDPTYTPVHIEFEVIADRAPVQSGPGSDGTAQRPSTDAVEAAVIAALRGYLGPRWNELPGAPRSWNNDSVVRYLDVVRVIAAAPGVAAVRTLTINGATDNVTLPGLVPYPSPSNVQGGSTISGTVIA